MDSKEILSSILNNYRQIDIDFDVYIVADTQNKTYKYMPHQIKHASESEFFSRTEFAEIVSAIFNCFGYAKVFYSEIEFIEYILNSKFNNSAYIVYNFSRDGQANGKKSLIPSFCDLLNIKYTGSDAFVISLLRNKYVYTKYLESNGINVPQSILFSSTTDYTFILNQFNNKDIIAKNRYESASIGLTKANVFKLNYSSLQKLNELLNNMCTNSLLLQEYIDGIECEVFVFQYRKKYYALEPVQILLNNDHNFIDSITSNTYNYKFKIIDSSTKNTIQKVAEESARLLGIKDYARFDFRIKEGIPYLFDIAGTPYTIFHSSIAYLFTEYYQLSYEDIYKSIVTCMLSNYNLPS